MFYISVRKTNLFYTCTCLSSVLHAALQKTTVISIQCFHVVSDFVCLYSISSLSVLIDLHEMRSVFLCFCIKLKIVYNGFSPRIFICQFGSEIRLGVWDKLEYWYCMNTTYIDKSSDLIWEGKLSCFVFYKDAESKKYMFFFIDFSLHLVIA